MSLFDQGRNFIGYAGDRPAAMWPGGAALAINVVVNYEEGSERSIAAGDAEGEVEFELSYARTAGFRNLAVESSFNYGSRVGFWRLMKLLDAFGIESTIFAAAVALELNPRVAQYLRGSSHEVACHGWRWEDVYALPPEEEWDHLTAAIASIERTIGRRPVGWYSRTHASEVTRDLLLKEGGFLYDSDALDDDLPYTVDAPHGQHLVIPYTAIYNDSRFVSTVGNVGPTQFVDYCVRAIDELACEGGQLLTIGLHPRIIGHAARISALREVLAHAVGRGDVWFATRAAIAEHWLALDL